MSTASTHFDLLDFGAAVDTLISFHAVYVQSILIATLLVVDTIRAYGSSFVFNCSIDDFLALSYDATDLFCV
jgi:hypothetical protein